jgi:hypothetical protein
LPPLRGRAQAHCKLELKIVSSNLQKTENCRVFCVPAVLENLNVAPDLLKLKTKRGVSVFQKILVLTVCLLTTSSAFGYPAHILHSQKQSDYAYKALTYIGTAELPPPVSKAVNLDQLKNNPADVLAESCYYAGALQLRLNNLFSLHPQASQAAYPLRAQMQTLIENGQKILRAACAVNAENKALSNLQRIANVQAAMYEVTGEAINLRNTITYQH